MRREFTSPEVARVCRAKEQPPCRSQSACKKWTRMEFREAFQRLGEWLRAGWAEPWDASWLGDRAGPPDAQPGELEYPWRHRWDFLPKRSAGFGFTSADYEAARQRAEEIARVTLGDEAWRRVRRVGYLDIPSRRLPGVTYRLRVGRRIEVLCAPGVRPPWPYPYLLHQSHLPLAGSGVLRPPCALRTRQRGPLDTGSGAAAVESAARSHILRDGERDPSATPTGYFAIIDLAC